MWSREYSGYLITIMLQFSKLHLTSVAEWEGIVQKEPAAFQNWPHLRKLFQ